MTEILRSAIVNSGLPMQRLSKATSVERTRLSRFVDGKGSLWLDKAEQVAAFVELELRSQSGPRRISAM